MELIRAERRHMKDIWKLYREAFPANERKPRWLLRRQRRRGIGEILALSEGDKTVGLVITAIMGELVLVDYLAVNEALRGGGIGSRALELIRERYSGRRIFLEIEEPREDAENNAQRIRRKAFYERCGVHDAGVRAYVYGCDFMLMTFGGGVTFGEYLALLEHTVGKFFVKHLNIKERASC